MTENKQEEIKQEAQQPEIEYDKVNSKTNIVLDMSKWDTFELCKARYHYRYNLNRNNSDKPTALDAGSLAHEGMEEYFLGIKNGKHFSDRMHETLLRMRSFNADPEKCNLDMETSERVISAIEESCTYWRHEDEQFEVLEVEQPFLYELYDDNFVRIMLSGKIDLLINMSLAGSRSSYKNLPIDHKTFSRDHEVPNLSNQFRNYCTAMNSSYLIVNRIGLHAAKTKKAPEERFKRIPISYTPYQLEDWRNNIISGILNEYLPAVARNEWRQSNTGCFSFNRKCEYYQICDSDSDLREQKLKDYYIMTTPWDVTSKLGKG